MLNVPEEIKSLLKSDNVIKNIRIQFPNNELEDINNDRINAESLVLDEALCTDNQLTFGSAVSSIFQITVINIQDITGYTIKPILEIICDTSIKDTVYREDIDKVVYPIPLGIFKVDSCKIENDKVQRKVVAYDKIVELSNTNVYSWYYSLTFPMTLNVFRHKLTEHLGLSEINRTLVNDNMMVERTIDDENLNAMDLFCAIAEINGTFVHFSRNGKLDYIKIKLDESGLYPSNTLYPSNYLYPSGNQFDFGSSNYTSFDYMDYTSNAPDKLQVNSEIGDIGAVVGTGTNMYIVTDNFLCYGKNQEDLTEIAEKLLTAINEADYVPFETECRALPYIEVGDYLKLIDNDGNEINTVILARSMSGIQDLRDAYSANGLEYYAFDVTTQNSEILKLKQKTNTVINEVGRFNRTITDMEEEINGNYTKTISYVDQTAEKLEAKISAATVEWDITGYDVSYYSYTSPPTTSEAGKYEVNKYYLDQSTGRLYKCATASSTSYTWTYVKQCAKKQTDYWSAIEANTQAIQTEVGNRQSAVSAEANARIAQDNALSSRITQTADSITQEVTKVSNSVKDEAGTRSEQINSLSSRISANANSITSEVTARQTAINTVQGNINSEASTRSQQVSDLSSRITQTSNSITSEVTARTNADNNLSTRISQTATSIEAKVSKDGGNASSFGWHMDSDSFKYTASNKEVMKVDKNGLTVNGIIQALSGYFGTTTQGFTIGSDGTLSSKSTCIITYYESNGGIHIATETVPVIKISPNGIEIFKGSSDGATLDSTYTYIAGGTIYSCTISKKRVPTSKAPWNYIGSNEMIIKDGNLYIPNRTIRNGEVGNIYIQENATQKSGGLVTGKYRKGAYTNYTFIDAAGTSRVLRIRNGILVGSTDYNDPFYDGEIFPS